MPITVACACGKSYPVRDEFGGQRVQCPSCGHMLTIPMPADRTQTLREAFVPAEELEIVEDVLDVEPADEVEDLEEVEPEPRRGGGGVWIVLGILSLILLLCGGLSAAAVVAVVWAIGPDPTVVQVGTNPATPGVALPPAPPPPAPPPTPAPIPPLPDLPAPSGLAYDGHQAPITAVAFSRDGRSALTAAGGSETVGDKPALFPDNTLRVWDVKTGTEQRRARNFRDGVGAAAFSPDARYAVLAGLGHWDAGVWSPNADGVLHLWDLENDREKCVFRGHTKRVFAVAFSPDGTRLLSGGADHTVRLWDVPAASEINKLEGHTNTVTSVAFSPDGRYGLSGSADMTVRLWDLNTGAEKRQFPGHKDIVWAVAFSPTGPFAASGGGMQKDPAGGGFIEGARDHEIRLWDVETGTEVRRCRGHAKAVGCLAFSRDGRRLLSGGADFTLRLWQVATGEQFALFTEHKDVLRAVEFFPDGRRALSGGEDKVLRVWSLPRDLPEVLQTLDDPNAVTRLSAARELIRFGAEVRPSIPVLIKALERDEPAFRSALLAVLSKAGPPLRSDAPLLDPLLKDRSFPGGRLYALESLAALGADYPATLPAIKAGISDTNATVKRRAVQLAGRLGVPGRAALYPALLDALGDADTDVAKDAAESLVKMGKPTADDVAQLNEMLFSPKIGVRRYAVLAVADMGRDGTKALLRLTAVSTTDREPELRRLGLAALAKVQSDKKELTKLMRQALKDPDAGVKIQAVASLGDLAPDADAVAALLDALSDPNAEVTKAVEDLLPKIKFEKQNARALAGALRANKNDATRLRLMETLVAVKPDTTDAGAALGEFLRDAKGDARPKIIEAIGDLGSAGSEAGPALAEFLKDDDRALRFEVALALCKTRSEQANKAVPLLVASLRVDKRDDKEGFERQEKAHKALVQLGKPAVDALAKSLGNEFFGGKLPTVEGLSKANARGAVIKTLELIGADAKDADKALADNEKEDPLLANRAAAKEARLKIKRLADGK
jgi:WD40 repeat protein/HEAT repeat protein